MKTLQLFLYVSVFCLSLTGCKEQFDKVDLTPPDLNERFQVDSTETIAAPALQQKNVLIEDFTGVKCTGCPAAQAEAESIAKDNPGRVSIIAIHTTNFAIPFTDSKYDFRTTDGANVLSLLGNPLALPIGAVDRKIHPGNKEILLTHSKWRTYVNSQLLIPSKINISYLEKSFDASTRFLSAVVKVTFTDTSNGPHAVSAALLESGMIDKQSSAQTTIPDYEQKHVLRKMLGSYNGIALNDEKVTGKTYYISIHTKINELWDADKSQLVIFVHKNASNNKEVLQVNEAYIK